MPTLVMNESKTDQRLKDAAMREFEIWWRPVELPIGVMLAPLFRLPVGMLPTGSKCVGFCQYTPVAYRREWFSHRLEGERC